jgi:AcrR family transcriptional regulator
MVQKEPKPRGRPRSFDADEVLVKARAAFWNLGYAATSLDDLATATGLNRPSLYAAFGDKHALYMATLERTRTGAVAAMRAMLGREGRLRDVLGGLFRAAIAGYVEGDLGQRGCFIVGTAVTQSVEDPQARALLTAFIADEDEMFRARFARADNELAAGMTPETAAMVATAALQSLAIRARTGEPAEGLARIADATVTAICGPGT